MQSLSSHDTVTEMHVFYSFPVLKTTSRKEYVSLFGAVSQT
jgi:hypothetical protein